VCGIEPIAEEEINSNTLRVIKEPSRTYTKAQRYFH
jgi:hypothetical protein